LRSDAGKLAKFTKAMIKVMTFVMSKLGAKGVFHNTLIFSGRFLVGSSPRQIFVSGIMC
jgi:hypothetical protein